MLVDGGVVDNIPLRSMKTLKAGPNLVVHFGARDIRHRFEVDYTSIPGRWQLLRQILTPSGRRQLPVLPNPIGVLQRCLGMHQSLEQLPLGPLDLVLSLPAFAARTSWISTATSRCSRRPINGAATRSMR